MTDKPFYPPVINVGVSRKFSVYGKSFFSINSVFLSGGVFGTETFFNPFSGSSRLSADYPGFNAVQLSASEYSYNNNNTLTFTMPSANSAGYVDVIFVNDAGWGKLTQFVIKDYPNPFTPGSDSFLNYESYQRPWKKGIIVN